MEKFKKICGQLIKRFGLDVVALAGMMAVITVCLYAVFDLRAADWSVPFWYGGGDEYSLINTARLVEECGWNTGTDRISATQDYYYNNNEIISGLHNADVLLVKFFMLVGGNDIGLAANLTYISAFYLIALVSYIVLRLLGLKRCTAASGGLVYAFLSFIFMRGMAHIGLSSYYFVPLAVLMAVWVYEDERFMAPKKGFFKYRRNIGGIVMAFLIASQGIGYWQVFACFFVMVAAVTAVIRTKSLKPAWRGVIAIASIAAAVVISCIPTFVSMAASAGMESVSRPRSAIEAELYGFKITQLFLPVNSHGISILEEAISGYNRYMPLVNENSTAYIGLAGIMGFAVLFVWLFVDKKSESRLGRRLSVLSDMNICAVLLATIGGFGGMVYLLGFDMLRCYNRISVFIAFICITALCLAAEYAAGRIKKSSVRGVFIAVFVVFMMFSLWEQIPEVTIDYEGNAKKWYGEKEFIENMEEVCNEDDKIYMLPYMSYPEKTSDNKIAPLSHLSGYFHSEKLRWSFGTVTGSESDVWCEETSKLPAAEMVQSLKEKGFAGIYINRGGYDEPELENMENTLREYLGAEPIVSSDGLLSFYKIQ